MGTLGLMEWKKSLESADPRDFDVLREKSNLGKIREKRVICSL